MESVSSVWGFNAFLIVFLDREIGRDLIAGNFYEKLEINSIFKKRGVFKECERN